MSFVVDSEAAMQYIIHLKWGGIRSDIIICTDAGSLVYTIRGHWRMLFMRRYEVIKPDGVKILSIRPKRTFINPVYLIYRDDKIVGKAGTRRLHSRGFIEISGMPRVECSYGWGLKNSLELSTESGEIGRIKLSRGLGVKAEVTLRNNNFDSFEFLAGCAMVFCDWSR